jgi:hypothetical protein
LREKGVAGLRFATIEVWGDIALWFFIGLLLAAVITVIIPDDMMASVMGGGIGSMLIMLLVGIPLYICATASTPIAAALILKGVSPGAALVFLLVGPATNVTSLAVLVGMLGHTVRYLLVLSIFAGLRPGRRSVLPAAAYLAPGGHRRGRRTDPGKPEICWGRHPAGIVGPTAVGQIPPEKIPVAAATHSPERFSTLPSAKPTGGQEILRTRLRLRTG